MANQIIYIDTPLEFEANTLISVFGDITIGSYDVNNSNSIKPTIVFSTEYNLGRNIDFVPDISTEISNISANLISQLASTVIGDLSFDVPNYAAITVSVDLSVTPSLGVQSIDSTLTFGDEEQLKLNLNIIDQGVASALVIGTANVFISIGPESFDNISTFGLPNRQNPVHRSLIYKNDNITKLGREDDVEIASGIVIQTSTAKLTGNTVPGSAAGYIKVTIDGTDYSMPFFELPEQ